MPTPFNVKIDMTGLRYGKLTTVECLGPISKGKVIYWRFKCDCGATVKAQGSTVRNGYRKCCGCTIENAGISHAELNTPAKIAVYRAWSSARQRCANPNDLDYWNYGGRGIKVCERWNIFECFQADMGPKPEPYDNYTLERKNYDGHYEPSNCKWATHAEQRANQRPRNTLAKRVA